VNLGAAVLYCAGLRRARRYIRQHRAELEAGEANGQMDAALESWSMQHIEAFLVTSSFGYPSLEAYYQDASSTAHIPRIRTPSLLLLAADDPLLG
jgi:predicted alpha/beta-fold hydrolase